ncbi:Hypothetical predicted protein, partial [Pelobates cultripes]
HGTQKQETHSRQTSGNRRYCRSAAEATKDPEVCNGVAIGWVFPGIQRAFLCRKFTCDQPVKRYPASPSKLVAQQLITEEKLRGLLNELCWKIAADIGQFQEKINRVSARLHTTELNTMAHEIRISSLEHKLQTLYHSQAQTQERMAALEDKRHFKNVKIPSLKDKTEAAELPHFLRRLHIHLLGKSHAAGQVVLDTKVNKWRLWD